MTDSRDSEQIIWLIGMMGSGKSTAGAALSERLGIPLVDTDDLVEQACGSTIPELWEREGEPGFRAREHDAVAEASRGSQVVATGGGVVMNDENIVIMRETGVVVFLDVTVPTLTTRVGLGGYRPLLTGGPDLELERIWAEREERYRNAAHHVVDGEGTPEEIADRVVKACGI